MSRSKSLVVVRDAHGSERETIVALTREAYAEYATVMAPDAWRALAQAIESGLASTAPADRIVAELGGKIVGSAMLFAPNVDAYAQLGNTKQLGWPEVRLVSVSPSARGQGIARALMDECVRRARRAGATAIGIHTSTSMRAAIALYKNMGFVRTPANDFHPAGAELVEAYVLEIARGD